MIYEQERSQSGTYAIGKAEYQDPNRKVSKLECIYIIAVLKLLKLFLSITTGDELQSLEPPKIFISLHY